MYLPDGKLLRVRTRTQPRSDLEEKALEEVEKDPEFAGALKTVKENEAYERSLKLTGGSSKNEYRDERPNRSLDDDYHVFLAGNEGYQRQLKEMKAKESKSNFVPISS